MKYAYLIFSLAVSSAGADMLSDVLLRVDQAAQKFRSVSTAVREIHYSGLFDETKVEEGTFKMRKLAKTGAVLLIDFTGRDRRSILIASNQLKIYHPKANSVDVYNIGKTVKSVDQFLLVGFGTSNAELQRTYHVSLGGSETIGATKTTRIELRPQKAETQTLINTIELWIPDGQGTPVQEKLIIGGKSKDYYLFEFSNRQVRTLSDPALPDSDFELSLPPGVVSHKL
jgi:outer membrane lipoprotein-sorting protein